MVQLACVGRHVYQFYISGECRFSSSSSSRAIVARVFDRLQRRCSFVFDKARFGTVFEVFRQKWSPLRSFSAFADDMTARQELYDLPKTVNE